MVRFQDNGMDQEVADAESTGGYTFINEGIPRNFMDDPRYHYRTGTQVDPTIDPMDRHESYVLAEGENKVDYEEETRVPNAAIFTFNKEDHTLGNLLRAKLVKSPHVLFAAYQVPHPLFAMFKLRVQTDGELTPKEAVVQACQDLVKELQILDQEFTKEFELKKIAGEGMVG